MGSLSAEASAPHSMAAESSEGFGGALSPMATRRRSRDINNTHAPIFLTGLDDVQEEEGCRDRAQSAPDMQRPLDGLGQDLNGEWGVSPSRRRPQTSTGHRFIASDLNLFDRCAIHVASECRSSFAFLPPSKVPLPRGSPRTKSTDPEVTTSDANQGGGDGAEGRSPADLRRGRSQRQRLRRDSMLGRNSDSSGGGRTSSATGEGAYFLTEALGSRKSLDVSFNGEGGGDDGEGRWGGHPLPTIEGSAATSTPFEGGASQRFEDDDDDLNDADEDGNDDEEEEEEEEGPLVARDKAEALPGAFGFDDFDAEGVVAEGRQASWLPNEDSGLRDVLRTQQLLKEHRPSRLAVSQKM